MSNYIDNPNSCRVDIWKTSGKWYTTETIIFFDSDYGGCIHKAFKNALENHEHIKNHYSDMRITCLEPYHQYSHPISLIWR